jgi:hypothetical protein
MENVGNLSGALSIYPALSAEVSCVYVRLFLQRRPALIAAYEVVSLRALVIA